MKLPQHLQKIVDSPKAQAIYKAAQDKKNPNAKSQALAKKRGVHEIGRGHGVMKTAESEHLERNPHLNPR